jgi:hypothetical protein
VSRASGLKALLRSVMKLNFHYLITIFQVTAQARM